MKQYFTFLFAILYTSICISQKPIKQNTSEIYESVKKLNFLGSVLYVAAHPDDENTRLISYFSNHVKARTGYLSMTRGDGGQNLIGSEIRELLGVIRTQELLAARRVDGGEQFFTRANDFGYSKHPDETLVVWNKDEVLKDLVSRIRNFKPDIIINRFNHRTPGSTHGHHTSSAMLSVEAFDLANDKNYKTHVGSTDLWQPKRVFFNTHWWFYGSQKKFAEVDKSKMLNFDIGLFSSSSGLSNNEVASIASSQHLSQGFGRQTTRGSEKEYVEFLKGDFPNDKTNIFDGIDTSWNRVNGGKAIGEILGLVEQNFSFKDPSVHLPDLLKAYQLIQKIDDQHWKTIKTKELLAIIQSCAGLYLEVSSNTSTVTASDKAKLSLEVLNRSNTEIKLKSIEVSTKETTVLKDILLKNNAKEILQDSIDIPLDDLKYTAPYWLEKKGTLGMYTVVDEVLIGKPETPRGVHVDFNLEINNIPITISKPVVYRYSKPDKGELYKPFEILPEVTASITDKVIIFSDDKAKQISVKVKAHKGDLKGSVSLAYPKEWKVSPKAIDFNILQKGGEEIVNFMITPPLGQSEGKLTPMSNINGRIYTKELIEINYDHIPTQSVLLPSESKIVKLEIEKKGQRIAYIQGAGDKIPENLRQIGYTVTELKGDQIKLENLQNFDAVVLGLRAYNIDDASRFYQSELHSYVEQGGTLLVQYNTSRRQKVAQVAPYELKLSRDRVTDENSEVTILNTDHEVLNYPNKITNNDFKGWVQERGLYFPDEWSDEFTPLLSMNDKGESPKEGSLLIAKYGKGNFIYTGLSFFRELPAGVPGAYRLFANLLSVGKNNIEKPIKN
jgi:LmbE family N-acetylglucosaminyl deacetylase